jgi:hypothetical protein
VHPTATLTSKLINTKEITQQLEYASQGLDLFIPTETIEISTPKESEEQITETKTELSQSKENELDKDERIAQLEKENQELRIRNKELEEQLRTQQTAQILQPTYGAPGSSQGGNS